MEIPEGWRSVDPAEHLAWLGSGGGTGFDLDGFEDSTWVLHPLEHDDDDPAPSGLRTWAEASAASGYTAISRTHPPSHAWWPHRDVGCWEGSLENPAYEALVALLVKHSPQGGDTTCFAYYATVPTIFRLQSPIFDGVTDEADDLLLRGKLLSLGFLPREFQASNGHDHGFSPNNIWPEDRAWLVYTDYDLWATKISGPAGLLAAVRADPVLETLDWHPA